MKTAQLLGAQQFAIVDQPVPEPGPGEVLLKIGAVGLCGSDLHSYREGNIGGTPIPKGYILGHEFAGEIVALGEGVTDRHIGQRVAVDPAIPCGQCDYCTAGRVNLCLKLAFAGHPPHNGALQQYMTHPARATAVIPDRLSLVEGAMLEPMGVGLHAVDLAEVEIGESVMIQGCGSIGLMMLQLARLAGAGRIVALDVIPRRLELAAQLGASETVLVVPGELPQIEPVHLALEATGSHAAMEQTVDLVRAGGRIVYVGIPDEDRVGFRAATARRKELSIQLSRRMKHMYTRAIALAEQGKVDLLSMVTHRFELANTARAFEVFSQRLENSIKVIVEPNV